MLLVGLVVVYLQRYRLGLDGVAYLSIAQRWLDGEVVRNAYWGPLTSWLATPLLAVGLPPVVAGHLVVLGSGLVAVLGTRTAGSRLVGDGVVPGLVAAVVLAPVVLASVSYGVFPDLLVGAVALLLVLALSGRWWAEPWRGAAVGGLVAAGLFAKVTGLVLAAGLVLVAVVLAALARRTTWLTGPAAGGDDEPGGGVVGDDDRTATAGPSVMTSAARWPVAWGTAAAVGVTVVLLGGWAAVLAPANDGPTLSSAPGYNAALLAPGVRGAPVLVDGLAEPPAPGAVSAWDDPTSVPISVQGTDDGDADVDVAATPAPVSNDVVGRVADNLAGIGRLLPEVLPLPLGLVGLLLALRDRRRRGTALLLLAGVGGALLVVLVGVVELRYLWPATVLAAPGTAVLAGLLPRRWQQLAAGLLAAGLVALPLVDGIALRADAGQETRATARTLVDLGIRDGRVASINRFQRSALVCLHADCAYLGQLRGDTDTELRAELDEFDVGWVLVWEPFPKAPPPGLEDLGGYGEARVYRVPDARRG